jgi:hypothetical protein
LLGKNDFDGNARKDDGPEKERGGETGRIIGRKDDVVEKDCEGEIEDVCWATNYKVKGIDTEGRVRASSGEPKSIVRKKDALDERGT